MTLGRLTTFVCVCAVVLAASAPMFAADRFTVRVTVPFAFDLQGKAMPAGQYELAGTASDQIFTLTVPGGRTAAVLTTRAGNPNEPKSPRLVFRQTARGYRLAEVHLQYGVFAGSIPLTREEAIFAKQHGDRDTLVRIALIRR
jgi:hypothetical protein